ncbi:beta-lactamase/transpeptidase-like protein [Penicillium atrosanguineum]|uniref:Beta-lactamase/transpeptidase-like protein n=1 Tax=Penicillium atrosanguineum TaxID=1132637 RepID=A0A9W9QD03_9EURO|nr:beta-lactamase/transpeptidase-like protein [Penicillium atrosanguineum]KAJ5331436.1 beta-lactamase/transpeptidase-like protein [Penicillium atrosanguineum]
MAKNPHSSSPLSSSFATLVQRTLDRWHVPGMAIAVVDGEDTWAEGYGFASMPSTPVTPSTLFYAGSTTKAFTAAMLAKLAEDPATKIRWDTPISQLLPGDFALHDKCAGDQITVEDALSHRTGLPSHDHASSRTSVRENVRRLAHLPLTAKIRTRYQYNNLMYVVASHIIETETGQWLGDCLARSFWRPLGMTDTYFALDDARAAPVTLAHGYCYSTHGDETVNEKSYHEVDWMPVEELSGAGAIITNVLDYAKWVRALLHPQTLVEKHIFRSPETVHQLWQPRTLMPAEGPFTGPRAYALGWRTGVYQGVQIYEHSGGMNAFGAQLLLIPEFQFGVIILANTAQTSNFAAQFLAYHLLDERLGVPGQQRFDWDRRNWSLIEQEKQRAADKINYRPPIVLPLMLPLDEYAGTYTHAGYKDVTVYLDSEGVLRADRKDMTWPEAITFQHVTGEHFLMLSAHHDDFGAFCPEVYEAEFRLSVEGKPWTLGIAWEREMEGEKIWFVRN